jgi:hypothetical protein
MYWTKMGLIFKPASGLEWMATHASLPTPYQVSDRVLRIYFSTRSTRVQSSITFVDVDADEPSRILYVHDRPVLSPGKLGTFDDGGVGPYRIIDLGDRLYLYYGGINAGVTVPYRNSVGLAVSDDGGLTFTRLFNGPIVERNRFEPYFVAAVDVMHRDGAWRMWYGATTGWTVIDGRPEPQYQIRYAESADGIDWVRRYVTCIDYVSEGEANVRPCVIQETDLYRMWYSFRGSKNFRTDRTQSYRLGYAESADGIQWVRKDEQVGIDRSDEGWDSIMMEYGYVHRHRDRTYLFYNGNGFGESGFGYARLEPIAD